MLDVAIARAKVSTPKKLFTIALRGGQIRGRCRAPLSAEKGEGFQVAQALLLTCSGGGSGASERAAASAMPPVGWEGEAGSEEERGGMEWKEAS